MKRIFAAIVLVSFCFLAGCGLFEQQQNDTKTDLYQNIKVDTNPGGPMLYTLSMSMYYSWGGMDSIILDENWDIVIDENVLETTYLINTDKPKCTPDAVFGMYVRTADENGDLKSTLLDKSGRQIAPDVFDEYYLNGNILNGYIAIYYYDEEDYSIGCGLFDTATETIVISAQYSNLIMLDENLIYVQDGDVCKFIDYSGNTVQELPGITYVETYSYDGGGALTAFSYDEADSDGRAGLIDLEGNWLTQTSYYTVDSTFFGDYVFAGKKTDNGLEIVLLDHSGEEYTLDLPTCSYYYTDVMPGFAVLHTDNDIYIVKTDRSVKKVEMSEWIMPTLVGNIVLITTETQTLVWDTNGNELEVIDGMAYITIGGTDRYVYLAEINDDGYYYGYSVNEKELYKVTDSGLEKCETNIPDIVGMTPDGRFFQCYNNSATGFKDLDGNWVYKQYLFNYLED